MADSDPDTSETRRQKRRQKILMGSEERMKKIMGYDRSPDGDSTEDISAVNCCESAGGILPDHSDPVGDGDQFSASKDEHESGITFTASQQADTDSISDNDQALDSPTVDEEVMCQSSKRSVISKNNAFTNIRTLLVLLSGLLVRILMESQVGLDYIQCLFNPFIAMEIALIGYQHATGMDLGEQVKGGVWLSTLVLAGINEDIIQTYKSVMGALSSAAADFTLFFFGFIVVHLVL